MTDQNEERKQMKNEQKIEETIGYLDMQSELKRLRKYEELVQFLFSDDLCPMAIHMEGEGYLMTPEEGFEIMQEYKQRGLERENAELKEALDLTIEDRDSYHEENAELRKNKDTDYNDRHEREITRLEWKNDKLCEQVADLECKNNALMAELIKEIDEGDDNKNRDTDYHDRLEREVTSLKREVILLETQNTKLTHDLNSAHRQIHDLRLDNEQLRQAIAVLNDEPTNSL